MSPKLDTTQIFKEFSYPKFIKKLRKIKQQKIF